MTSAFPKVCELSFPATGWRRPARPALNYLDGHLVSVVSVLIEGGQIQRLFIVVNPDKLPRQALTL